MGVWRSWFPLSVKEKMDLLEPMVRDNVLSDDEIKKLKDENVISDDTANHTNEIRTDLVSSFLPVLSGKDQKIPQSDQTRAVALVSKIFSDLRVGEELTSSDLKRRNNFNILKEVASSLSRIPEPLIRGLADFFQIPDEEKCFTSRFNGNALPLCSELKRDPSLLKNIFEKYTFTTQPVFESFVLSVGPIAVKPLLEVYLETKNNLLISLLTKLVNVPCSFHDWSKFYEGLKEHKDDPSLKSLYLFLLLNTPQFESFVTKESGPEVEKFNDGLRLQLEFYQKELRKESEKMLDAFLRGVINLDALPEVVGTPLEGRSSGMVTFSDLCDRYQSEKDVVAKQKLLALLQKRIGEKPVYTVFSELHRIKFPESLLPDEVKDQFFLSALKMGSFSFTPESKKLLLGMIDKTIASTESKGSGYVKKQRAYVRFFNSMDQLDSLEVLSFLKKSHRNKFKAFLSQALRFLGETDSFVLLIRSCE